MRTCLFCESSDVTREHVWPQWIAALFHAKPRSDQYKIRREDPYGQSTQRTSKTLDVVAKVVCAGCNNGWMHDLENETRPALEPVILGKRRAGVIDADEQAALNAWATKAAMVFEHTTNKKASRFYLPEERRAFAESCEPPQSVYIWAAQYVGPLATHSTVTNLMGGRRAGHLYPAQLTTIVVRHLVLQILGGRWSPGASPDVERIDASPFGSRTVRLWPASRAALRWPPGNVLKGERFKEFTTRFMNRIPMTGGIPNG